MFDLLFLIFNLQLFFYSIVIFFNLFLRNLLLATIVTEFRERSLPKKYSGKKKLIRSRTVKRKKRAIKENDETDPKKAKVLDKNKDPEVSSPVALVSPNPTIQGEAVSGRPVSSLGRGSESSLLHASSPGVDFESASPSRDAANSSVRNMPAAASRMSLGGREAEIEDADENENSQAARKPETKVKVRGIRGWLREIRRAARKAFSLAIRFINGFQAQILVGRRGFRAYIQRIYYRLNACIAYFPRILLVFSSLINTRIRSADDTTCLCLPSSSPIRFVAAIVVYHPRFESTVVFAILVSAVFLAAPNPPAGPLLKGFNAIETAVSLFKIFVILWLTGCPYHNCLFYFKFS